MDGQMYASVTFGTEFRRGCRVDASPGRVVAFRGLQYNCVLDSIVDETEKSLQTLRINILKGKQLMADCGTLFRPTGFWRVVFSPVWVGTRQVSATL